ncbi:hypothetical protein APR64_16660 [Enterobacter hormaechei]|nr:hypothetical protein AXJ76_19395 [Enterobacter cloacae]KJL70499.1 hypothetical protein SS38_14890 [Enterobacter hormaechei subsp. xiangfangensis]KSX12324.1 hypothetical protein APT79_23970 [Enterobacter sp. K66-74]KTJ30259.1 hypothetical protein ASU87_19335 [Enterobacter roggenkampii]KUH51831.1 hypothetical protein APR64_16660 [Enterobacter hormaechei]OJX55867.1 MAG: hypothetical protein BGO85_07900 [Enterobacter sp. 56-7]
MAIWHYQRGNIIPFNKPLKNQVVKLKTFCTMQQLAYYNSAYIMRRAKNQIALVIFMPLYLMIY